MKIIYSHDVDHLDWSEHFLKDLFIPKWMVRNTIYLLSGKLSPNLFIKRVTSPFQGRLNNIEDLIAIEKSFGIVSTFFVGMDTGLGMSYSLKAATEKIEKLLEAGFHVGVHGIAYDTFEGVTREYKRFKRIVGSGYRFGIRNHYLRSVPSTLKFQERAGYLFDSTVEGLFKPYSLGSIWEIPMTLMDVSLIPETDCQIKDVRGRTLALLQRAQEKQIPYFVVNTHDIYFSENFPVFREWYLWLLEYLTNRFEAITFSMAVDELLNFSF